jgi:hypothetical protein
MGMSVMSDVTLVPQKSDIWWVCSRAFPESTLVALTTVLGFYWLVAG